MKTYLQQETDLKTSCFSVEHMVSKDLCFCLFWFLFSCRIEKFSSCFHLVFTLVGFCVFYCRETNMMISCLGRRD